MFGLFKKNENNRFTKRKLDSNTFKCENVTLEILGESREHDPEYKKYLREKKEKEEKIRIKNEELLKNELTEKYKVGVQVYHPGDNCDNKVYKGIITEFIKISNPRDFFGDEKFFAEVIVKNLEGDYFLERSDELILASKI